MTTALIKYACALVIYHQGTLHTAVNATMDFAQPKGSHSITNNLVTGTSYEGKVSCGDICTVRIIKKKNGKDIQVASDSTMLGSKGFTVRGADTDANLSFTCTKQ